MTTSEAIAAGAAILGAGLTVLAIVIAIASLWGILTIRKLAKESAQKVATDKVLELFTDESELSRKLKAEIQKRVEAEADRLYGDLSMSLAFQRTPGQELGKVGEEYPPREPNAT
jgi:uncharacterized membrane protein YhiD involved in acid resistance